MSPRVVCALEEFGECSKWFRQYRTWQKCCCSKHTKRLGYLLEKKERSGRRRRTANRRAQAAAEPPWEAPKRVRCRTYIEVGFARKALGLVSSGWLGMVPGFPRPKAADLES